MQQLQSEILDFYKMHRQSLRALHNIMKENKSNTLLSCEEIISNDKGIETDLANIRREVHSLRSKI